MRSPGYRVPGVTVRSAVQSAPRARDEVRTDVAGFLGFAERGPTQRAIRVENWDEYRTLFGGHVRGAFLSHAVQGFFANGGRACWVVRIATRVSLGSNLGRTEHPIELPPDLAEQNLIVSGDHHPTHVRRRALLTAVSPGPWGRGIRFGMRRLDRDRFSVELRCLGSETEVREGLEFEAMLDSINTEYLRKGERKRSGLDIVTRPDVASNIARVRLQLLVRLPSMPELGVFDYARPSKVDLVVTIDDYRAWKKNLRLGWLRGPETSLKLGIGVADGERDFDFCVDAAEPVELAKRLTGIGSDLGNLVEHRQREAAGLRSDEPSIDASLRAFVEQKHPTFEGRVAAHLELEAKSAAIKAHADELNRLLSTHLGAASRPYSLVSLEREVVWRPQRGDAMVAGLDPHHFGIGTSNKDTFGLRLFDEIEEIGIIAAPDAALAFGLDPEMVRLHDIDRPIAEPATDIGALAGLPVNAAAARGAFGGYPSMSPTDGEALMLRVQSAMLDHCTRKRDRVAVLDVPADSMVGRRPPITWRENFDSEFGALYFPWVLVADPRGGAPLAVPPSGHLAGLCAQLELSSGPHEAPANVPLVGCLDATVPVTDRNHAELNDAQVNVIRMLPGRGVRALGARNLGGPDAPTRFISVRRLLNWTIASLESRLSWTVFEPNGPRLREDVERVVRAFLAEMWRRTMLDGAHESDAYHVLCDETLNPPDHGAENRLICELGIRPPAPAEYVIVQLIREEDRSSVVQTRGGQRV